MWVLSLASRPPNAAALVSMVSEAPSITFKTESRMVRHLSAHVREGRGPIRLDRVKHEFGYSTGWTDIFGIGRSNALHAHEAKLQKWREALNQARKNRCYAHYCYVALPESAAKNALSQEHEFRKLGVGLLIVTAAGAQLAIRPKRNAPLLPWITKVAVETLAGSTR